ncbi:nodulation protein S (NodS) [Pseudonocardia sediminis]|uniref:Nodulation protein S (NodS) n=1 Tax=Pseudonocardia sediminis TaxID=1397368 RepID=A0A4Q7V0A5_PSEST|nr:class I SAM-dependent methyltransferase [Pseudonocardia sediminis]RZT87872.1 nodulation protein S (NodS) [Pseudonocardia sediminis]
MVAVVKQVVPVSVRRRVRSIGGSAVSAAAQTVRAGVRWGVRRAPRLGSAVAGWTWLWQPGWSRREHERLYAEVDPYGFDQKPFEAEKYRRLIDALGDRRYSRGLEIGCSEGAFSERLVKLCDGLVAVDISEAAVRRARERTTDPTVRFERRTLPYDCPEGPFDLVVCSDILYMWEPGTLELGLELMSTRLRPGGRIALLHYLGELSAPMSGEGVHQSAAAVAHRLGLRHVGGADWPDFGPHGSGYRYDCWERVAV